ncbi:hypothetical protein [Corallococcus sp. 4LFB]|uniref:hypothetical protein n=1 Tax=Corallococcus sp. 4LFB TaxID=3383249 RepID=UPI0039770283
MEDASGSAWRAWAKRAAAWSAPALFSALETYTFSRGMPEPPALWRVLAGQMPAWYVWLPLTPWLARLAAREPLSPRVRARCSCTWRRAWAWGPSSRVCTR